MENKKTELPETFTEAEVILSSLGLQKALQHEKMKKCNEEVKKREKDRKIIKEKIEEYRKKKDEFSPTADEKMQDEQEAPANPFGVFLNAFQCYSRENEEEIVSLQDKAKHLEEYIRFIEEVEKKYVRLAEVDKDNDGTKSYVYEVDGENYQLLRTKPIELRIEKHIIKAKSWKELLFRVTELCYHTDKALFKKIANEGQHSFTTDYDKVAKYRHSYQVAFDDGYEFYCVMSDANRCVREIVELVKEFGLDYKSLRISYRELDTKEEQNV